MSEDQDAAPLCFVVSAPSGGGKSTLADELLRRVARMNRTVSCTTRAQRAGESDGVDYHFETDDGFARRRDAGEFLEWARVHGHLYGTLRSELDRIHADGDDALMVIDVQGAASVRTELDGAVTVFVLPPSRQDLERRLLGRDSADAAARAAIQKRLGVAAREISRYVGYDYLVVNDDFEEAVADLVGIVRAERSRRARRTREAEAIRASFADSGPVGLEAPGNASDPSGEPG